MLGPILRWSLLLELKYNVFIETQIWVRLKLKVYLLSLPEVYLEPHQISLIKFFAKIVNG